MEKLDIKQEVVDERKEVVSLGSPPESGVYEVDPAFERKLVLKLDLKLLPVLFTLLLLQFLDRTNIGNARIQGMEDSLHMKGNMYAIALQLFFVPFVLLEVPSNIVMKNISPSLWLSFIMFGWGKSIHYHLT